MANSIQSKFKMSQFIHLLNLLDPGYEARLVLTSDSTLDFNGMNLNSCGHT